MPTERISFRSFMGGLWLKGPKENTPASMLRRAKSLFPPRGASLMSRSGSTLFFNLAAHSLFKFVSNRIIGAGTGLFKGTTPGSETAITIPTGITLTGERLNFMEIPAQFLSTNPNIDTNVPLGSGETDFLFVSGSVGSLTTPFTPFKLDAGFNVTKWGIGTPTPAQLPTATVQAQQIFDIETLQAADAGAWSEYGGRDANPIAAARSATGGTSLKVRNLKDDDSVPSGEAIIVKGFATKDLTHFGALGPASSDEDYIGVWVHLNKPAHVQKLKITLFVGAGAINPAAFSDPNLDTNNSPYNDYYSIEVPIKVVKRREVKTLKALADVLPFNAKRQQEFLKQHPLTSGVDLTLQQFTTEGQLEVTNNTWTHLLVPKNRFNKNGRAGQVNFTFANVVGVELSIENNSQGKCAVWWDHLQLIGGAGMKGDYLYTITFLNNNTGSRSNPPLDTAGSTPQTNPNYGQIQTVSATAVDRQPVLLSFTLTSATVLAFDPQITHVEVWRNIGNGGYSSFFKVPVATGGVTGGTSPLPGIPVAALSGVYTLLDTTADYVGMFTGGGSSQNVLNPDELLTTDNSPPPFTITKAVYHPPSGRVFALTTFIVSSAVGAPFGVATTATNRILYSPPGRPEALGSGGFIEPTTPDDPIQTLVVWGDGLYAISQKRLFVIQGFDEPFISLEAIGVPGTTQPFTAQATPLGIIYQARDGVRVFNGTTSELIAGDALAQIFRGSTAEGIPPFTGIVASYGRNEYVISDTNNTTLALDLQTMAWRQIGFPIGAVYHEKDTNICLASGVQTATTGTGVWLVTNGTGAITLSTSIQWLSLAQPALTDTVSFTNVQAVCPITVTAIKMTVLLSAALVGGGSFTLKLFKNAVDTAFAVTINSGGSTGSFTGTLAIAANDLIALRATFTGGTTSASVQSVAIAYTAPLG